MNKNGRLTSLLGLVVLLAATVLYYYSPKELKFEDDTRQGELSVYYLDVGQADSTLLVSGGEAMLIDAGEKSASQFIVEHIKGLGVEKLTYVVATHPHNDHIGGMAGVLKDIPTESILMPDVTHTTRTFEDLIDTIDELKLDMIIPKPGDTFALGETNLTILSPEDKEYGDLNNYSIVVKADCGNTSFLFMGDAEKEIETRLLEKGINLKSTVLKVGHHGSNSSSTYEFLKEVSPKYAVISCGVNNDYDHPHEEVVERLAELGVETMGTHEHGTISAVSDGSTVSFKMDR